jgi:taurine dioxygenase
MAAGYGPKAPEIVALRDPGTILIGRRAAIPGFSTGLGPMAHLASAREHLDSLAWKHFDARPIAATVGAVLSGVDLAAELPDAVIDELRRALVAYKVIFFRDQALTAAQQVSFAKRFGELEIHPFIPPNPEQPELVRFEKSAEVGGYENQWHHDVTWRERPSMGAVLHAVEVQKRGGDTLFCDMNAAYEGLSEERKRQCDGLSAVHDFMKAFGHQVPRERRAEMRAKYPPVVHPVVRTHPESGLRSLYVNRIFTSHILGMDARESTALIDSLCREADYPEYQCRFQWEKDSVAFWDNRAVQHYAASDYWPEVRIMERASIIGDRPV